MAILFLEGEEKTSHLDKLALALTAAKNIPHIQHYGQIPKILNYLAVLRGGEGFARYDRIEVETKRSGIPHFHTFSQVRGNVDNAPRFIGKLPTIEQITNGCLDQLHSPLRDPKKRAKALAFKQQQARKLKFFTDLQTMELPEMAQVRIEEYEHKKKHHELVLVYEGFDSAKMRFLTYGYLVFQKKDNYVLKKDEISKDLEAHIRKTVGYATPEAFTTLNNQNKFAMVFVERTVIGPFYSSTMDNENPKMSAVFDSSGDDAFMLEIEHQLSGDDQTFLCMDLSSAMDQQYKVCFQPTFSKTRHFLCSSEQLINGMAKVLDSDDYKTQFYDITKVNEGEVNFV